MTDSYLAPVFPPAMAPAAFERLLAEVAARRAAQFTETAPAHSDAVVGPVVTAEELAAMSRGQLDAHAAQVWNTRFAEQDAARSPFWRGIGPLGDPA
ncbi:MAG: hypothetical protein JOZ47_14095 [Kutzneria sp.]|nr:hypothetical protein [Kutzneria sp.]MBV9846183.1 hypothetical protein [Kutzneria sp.]